jgi:hypothetical protein
MPAISVRTPVAVGVVGGERVEEGITLPAWVDGGGKAVTACLFGCLEPVKAVRKPVHSLVVVDVNGGKLVATCQRVRVLTDHDLGKRHADLGAFGTNALHGEQVSHGRVLLCAEVAVRGRDI